MLAPRLPHPRSRSQRTAHAIVHASAITADAATVRALLTLALAARGLIEIIDAFGYPWTMLIETLLLALVGVGFVVASRRSYDHRRAWLLAGAVAIGLATTTSYHFIITAFTAASG